MSCGLSRSFGVVGGSIFKEYVNGLECVYMDVSSQTFALRMEPETASKLPATLMDTSEEQINNLPNHESFNEFVMITFLSISTYLITYKTFMNCSTSVFSHGNCLCTQNIGGKTLKKIN